MFESNFEPIQCWECNTVLAYKEWTNEKDRPNSKDILCFSCTEEKKQKQRLEYEESMRQFRQKKL